MIRVEQISYPAFTGREKRRLYIYLPAEYMKDRQSRYPVLYMFDGHNVFFNSDATYGKSWGLGTYLSRRHIPLIVVALECHHGAHGERVVEYSPYDYEMPEHWLPEEERGGTPRTVHGRGDETLAWFTKVLKPRIDRKYRTLPDREHTFLMGSSMGGLMALHGLAAWSEVFSRVCALSPAFELWQGRVEEVLEHTELTLPAQLYMDYGMEEGFSGDTLEEFHTVAAMFSEKGAAVTARTIPGGTHCEASWERQLPFAITALMYGL